MSFATDILKPILEDMGAGLGSFFGLQLTDVLKSPAEFSPTAAELMDTIAVTVVSPAAATVLVVLYVLELNRIALRTDGDGELFVKTAFFTLIKFALVKLAFDNVGLIVGGVSALLSDLATQANLAAADFNGFAEGGAGAEFLESVEDMDWIGQTVLLMLMVIAWLVNKGAAAVALALVVVRFVKLFIFTAFAPMPMAFFASQDTRQYAIGFIRNLAGALLQAFTLVLAVAIYQAVASGWGAQAAEDLGGGVTAAASIAGNYIFMGVVLAMITLGSARLANEILGN